MIEKLLQIVINAKTYIHNVYVHYVDDLWWTYACEAVITKVVCLQSVHYYRSVQPVYNTKKPRIQTKALMEQ